MIFFNYFAKEVLKRHYHLYHLKNFRISSKANAYSSAEKLPCFLPLMTTSLFLIPFSWSFSWRSSDWTKGTQLSLSPWMLMTGKSELEDCQQWQMAAGGFTRQVNLLRIEPVLSGILENPVDSIIAIGHTIFKADVSTPGQAVIHISHWPFFLQER